MYDPFERNLFKSKESKPSSLFGFKCKLIDSKILSFLQQHPLLFGNKLIYAAALQAEFK